jgi:hypothetical protein
MMNWYGADRSPLLKMAADEWAALRKKRPEVDDHLRRACNIHGSQPIFDATSRPTALLSVRLRQLRPPKMRALADFLVAGSPWVQHENADDDKDSMTVQPSGQHDFEPAEEPTSRIAHAEQLISDLRGSQTDLTLALTRMKSQVEQGTPASYDDIDNR